MGFFGGIQNKMKIRGSDRVSRPCRSANKVQPNLRCVYLILSGNFLGSEIRHGIFWGLIFGPGMFLGFVGSPRDLFGF